MPPRTSLIERALTPLDAARSLFFRHTGALLCPLMRDRHQRIAALGALSITSALVLTIVAPVWMLSVTPLVLGVPHLLSDLRYLIVRQQLHRRLPLVGLVTPCLLMSIVDVHLYWGLGALALTALLARTSPLRRALMLVPCLLLTALAYSLGQLADVVFAHVHNLLALAIWVRWSRSPRATFPVLGLFVACACLILSGSLDAPLVSALIRAPAWQVDSGELLRTLSPTTSAAWSVRLLGFFAFAQAVHYGVWLKLIPEEDRARAGIRSFRGSYRALARDLGEWLPVSCLLLTAALCMFAVHDVASARGTYLRLALFHGPLEMAVLTLLALEGRPFAREQASVDPSYRSAALRSSRRALGDFALRRDSPHLSDP